MSVVGIASDLTGTAFGGATDSNGLTLAGGSLLEPGAGGGLASIEPTDPLVIGDKNCGVPELAAISSCRCFATAAA